MLSLILGNSCAFPAGATCRHSYHQLGLCQDGADGGRGWQMRWAVSGVVAYAYGGQAGLGGAEGRFGQQLASCGAFKLAAR
jgi:hypothetical protein